MVRERQSKDIRSESNYKRKMVYGKDEMMERERKAQAG